MPRWCRCKALGSDPEKFCQTMPRNFVAQKLPAAIALLGSLHDAFDLSWRDDSVVCFFGVEARKMPNFNINWKQCSWFFSTKWGSKASCAGFSRLQNCSKKIMRSFSTCLNFLKHPLRSQTHCSLSKMALTLKGSDPFSECLGALFKKGYAKTNECNKPNYWFWFLSNRAASLWQPDWSTSFYWSCHSSAFF